MDEDGATPWPKAAGLVKGVVVGVVLGVVAAGGTLTGRVACDKKSPKVPPREGVCSSFDKRAEFVDNFIINDETVNEGPIVWIILVLIQS